MIYLAFPGMGKTPLAKKRSRYVDLDFGFFRSALDVPKDKEESIIPQFAKLCQLYEKEGFIVLTNEPKLMRYTRVSKVFLPEKPEYPARKMCVSVDTINTGIEDGAELAGQNSVPVRFIRTGLDHYLI